MFARCGVLNHLGGIHTEGLRQLADRAPLRLRHLARLIVLEDVRGATVIMGFAVRAAEFDDYAPEAQKVIDTVQWRGS